LAQHGGTMAAGIAAAGIMAGWGLGLTSDGPFGISSLHASRKSLAFLSRTSDSPSKVLALDYALEFTQVTHGVHAGAEVHPYEVHQ
jgi:hypothetical protein